MSHRSAATNGAVPGQVSCCPVNGRGVLPTCPLIKQCRPGSCLWATTIAESKTPTSADTTQRTGDGVDRRSHD